MMKSRFKRNARNRGCGLTDLLVRARAESAAAVFLDPQYRALLDKMNYGNDRSPRATLPQTETSTIIDMRQHIARVMRPGGYLFQWTDKLEGFSGRWGDHNAGWGVALHLVDVITWEKPRWGQGYRSRRKSEFLLILQRSPKSIKTWTDHSIPDVWSPERERAQREALYFHKRGWSRETDHPHLKPVGLQARLIASVTRPGDLVIDPCAGGYSVLEACRLTGRQYLGCDLRG